MEFYFVVLGKGNFSVDLGTEGCAQSSYNALMGFQDKEEWVAVLAKP